MGAHEAMRGKSLAQCLTRAKCSPRVRRPRFSCSGKLLRLLHTHLSSPQPTLGVHVSRLCYQLPRLQTGDEHSASVLGLLEIKAGSAGEARRTVMGIPRGVLRWQLLPLLSQKGRVSQQRGFCSEVPLPYENPEGSLRPRDLSETVNLPTR